jgi:hypothetical protein
MQAELTAGINHTSMHEGWLDVILVFANHDCDLLIGGCEKSTAEQPKEAAADPEQLLSHIRTCCTVQRLQVLIPSITFLGE